MSEQSISACTSFSLARWVDLLLALVALEATGARAVFVVTLVDLGVGVTKLDCNVPLKLILEPNSLYS